MKHSLRARRKTQQRRPVPQRYEHSLVIPLDLRADAPALWGDTRARGWVHSLTNAEREPGMGFEPGVIYAWVELTPLGNGQRVVF